MIGAGIRHLSTPAVFPLSISGNRRYLLTAAGAPFLIHGDTPWSIAAQLTDAQVDQYLTDRAAKGFNAILFNAIEHLFTSQSPAYNNVDGVAPFASMTDFGSSKNAGYWNRVDYLVNQAKAKGILCIINPAYLGVGGGSQGWMSEVTAETAGDLQAYGAFLANRYTQGNVLWCLGGDYSGTPTERDKQWNIVTGIRSVRMRDLITAHSDPGEPAYLSWNTYAGWSVNTAYANDQPVFSKCATEYARSGPIPFFMIEAIYEQERASPISATDLVRQSFQALLSGACGQMFGNNPIWHFGSPSTLFTYSGTWQSNLASTGSTQQIFVKRFFDACAWWKLVPKTDTSLVTTALGAGVTRICPALASDGSFAIVWTPSANFTLDMTALAPSSVRARWYNPADGSYASAGGPFANSGTQAFVAPGERALLLDAA